jgi:hypothetical protein
MVFSGWILVKMEIYLEVCVEKKGPRCRPAGILQVWYPGESQIVRPPAL